MITDPHQALEAHFGFGEFRSGQEEIVRAIAGGRDALVVMPTGGGKSLCYQLPALMREGITLVVSPLIALMKDQVDALDRRGIPAGLLTSVETDEESESCLDRLQNGGVKFLYVSPDRFICEALRLAEQRAAEEKEAEEKEAEEKEAEEKETQIRSALYGVVISLVVVDDAEWLSTAEFRTEQLQFVQALEAIKRPQVAALTAEVSPTIRRVVLQSLEMRDPFVWIAVGGDPLHHFGYLNYRRGQEKIIKALNEKRDVLAVMPTGEGKSFCFLAPSVMRDGLTIVVSPLIALMKDQVDTLWQRFGIPAGLVNSTQTLAEQREQLQRVRRGELKLLYVSPERFRAEGFRASLEGVPISLFAVDEAHCLSQWGHDFRPDYLRLGQALEELGHPQVAAFTATATPAVRRDILQTLKLREPFVSITGFERPNLSLRIHRYEAGESRGKKRRFDGGGGVKAWKQARLSDVLKQWKTGIVYCATRKSVEEVAEHLQRLRLKAIAYHGGMSDELRKRAQEEFISRGADVVVATNAFGMGIDRADVRFVVHYDVPGSIEAYYQEAGRAGRDGEQAVCELLFNYPDTETQRFFVDGNNPTSRQIRNVYSALLCRTDDQQTVTASLADIADWANEGNPMAVGSALAVLARSGHIHRFDVPGQRTRGTRITRPEVGGFELELDEQALAAKRKSDEEKLAAMIRFCYDDRCRQQWILRYFGEAAPDPCGSCDVCLADSPGDRRAPTPDEMLLVRKLLSGVARMSHRDSGGYQARFGRGKIVGMLTGSRSEEILQRGLDRLPTFGLLQDHDPHYLGLLFRELEKSGLLKTEMGEYPLVTLTERGVSVMKEETPFQLAWPGVRGPAAGQKAARKRTSPRSAGEAEDGADLPLDAALLEQLKRKRAEIAQAEGKAPFLIFSNQTLEFLARARPRTEEQAREVKGVGEVKAERYLAPFLEVIRSHPDPQR